MPNLAMRQPGSQFTEGVTAISWPIGGEREVVAVPDEDMTLRIRRRIAEGQIVITDDKPTTSADTDAREYKLLTGEEARKRIAEPAGPVTRVVYRPAVPEDDEEVTLEIPSIETDPVIVKEQAAEREAEDRSAALAKEKAEAEHAAAVAKADAEAKASEVPVEEPVKEPATPRAERTQEGAAAYLARRDEAFMKRETEQPKQEAPAAKATEPKVEAPAPKPAAKASQPKATTAAKKAPAVRKPPTPRASTKS